MTVITSKKRRKRSNKARETHRKTYLQEGPAGQTGSADAPVFVLLHAELSLRVKCPVFQKYKQRRVKKCETTTCMSERGAVLQSTGAAFTGPAESRKSCFTSLYLQEWKKLR